MSEELPTLDAFVASRGEALVHFAYLLTGGDQHRAEDLVQTALATVLRRWGRICSGGRPEAYLRRAIVNEFLSWRRRRASTEVVTASLPETGSTDATSGVDDRDAAWRLIADLPPRQRAVLALRYLEGWPDTEIAAACGCSTATVRSQASRALGTLRERLGSRWTVTVGRDDSA